MTAAKFGTNLLFLAQQRKNIQKDSFNGHRSALYHLYHLHGLCYTRQMEAELKAFMSGLKRRVARKHQKTSGRVASGKEPVSFELYEKMCMWALSLGGRSGLFLFCYMVLTWNLACRRYVRGCIHILLFHNFFNVAVHPLFSHFRNCIIYLVPILQSYILPILNGKMMLCLFFFSCRK
jgi:hypothetical protein